MEFVDIHGHYAWGIDDGIRNLDEARAALQNASKVGVRVIAATPHVISGTHFEMLLHLMSLVEHTLKKISNTLKNVSTN